MVEIEKTGSDFIESSNVIQKVANGSGSKDVDIVVASSGSSSAAIVPASYVIYIDGSVIKAANGTTGNIDYSGTDAYTVIHNAINSGDFIFIKPGLYKSSQTFTFDKSWAYKKIQGVKGHTILQSAGTNRLIYLKNENLLLNFEGITFDGNNTACNLIYADDAETAGNRSTYFVDCEIKNSSSNAIFIKGDNVDGVYFSRCYIVNNIGNIRLEIASPHIEFDDCFFIVNGPGYILKSLAGCVRFTNCLFVCMNNARGFIMNDLEGNTDWLGKVFVFSNCHIEGSINGSVFSIGNITTGYRYEQVIIENSWIANENNPDYIIDIQMMEGEVVGGSSAIIKNNLFALPTIPNVAYINLKQVDNVIIEGNIAESVKPMTNISSATKFSGRILEQENSGRIYVSAGATSLKIAHKLKKAPSKVFAMPEWNTNYWLGSKDNTNITISFGNVSPKGGSYINWYVNN